MPTAPRRGLSQDFTQADGVTLREYFESRFDAMDKALEISQKSNDARLERMNEFREAMKDQAGRFITREMADATRNQMLAEIRAEISTICADIDNLKKYQATMEGKASQTAVFITLGIAILGLALTVVSLLLPHL